MKNLLFALILAVGLFLPFVQSVDAISANYAVTGEAVWGAGGTYQGGTTNWANMNSDDDATSCLAMPGTSGWNYHIWNLTDFAVVDCSIDSVVVHMKLRDNGYGVLSRQAVARNVGGAATFSNFDHMPLATMYAGGGNWEYIYSGSFTTDPATGLAWTTAGLNNCEFGLREQVSAYSGSFGAVTLAYITVNYTLYTAPTVTTQAVTLIAPTTATGNGNIISNGGQAITEKGICYIQASSGDPTTGSSTVHDHIDSTGAFIESLTGLTKGLPYRLRAYGINATGTGYGVTVDMTTIGDPTISTVAASLVTESTARLNSQVTFDGAVGGGELCTVTFAYKIGTLATYDLCAAGAEVVAGTTYTVNQLPYVDIGGLTGSSTYSFAVKISNATGVDVKSAAITFGTGSGVYIPTNFTAIPTSTTISYAWAKGVGAQYTLVRYSGSAYPATPSDGVLGYLNTANSFQLSGITPGTTIYASAWGKTGTTYSGTGPGYTDGKIDVMVTTLAYDSTSTTGSLVTPTPSSTWTQNPDATKVSTIPIYGAAVQNVAIAYNQPVNYLWYFIWILVAVGAAIAVYIKGQFNFVLALSTMIGIIGVGVFWYNLVAGLVVVVLAVIGIGWAVVGFRRPGT